MNSVPDTIGEQRHTPGPADGATLEWQDRVIRPFATLLAVAGMPVLIVVMVISSTVGWRLGILVVALGLIGILRWRQARWPALTAAIVSTLSLVTLLGPSQTGLRYAAIAIGCMAVAVAATFLGTRVAVAVALLLSGSLLVDGYGFTHGWFELQDPTPEYQIGSWVRGVLVLFVVSGALSRLMTGTVQSLEEALAASRRTLEQLRAEQHERQTTETRLSLAVDASQIGLWDWNIAKGSTYFSPKLHELLGLRPDALGDRVDAFLDLVHPDDVPLLRGAIDAHLRRHLPYDISYRVQTTDRGYRWYAARGQAVWDTAGTPIRFSGSMTDITGPREAAEALQESRASLKAFIDALPGPAMMFSPDLTISVANQSLAKDFGLATAESLIGQDIFARFPSPLREKRLALVRRALETGQPMRFEDEHKGVAYENGISPILDADGRVLSVAVFAFDVTERRLAEAAREQSLSLTLATIESTADGILVVSTEGKIQLFNSTFAHMWRLDEKALAKLDPQEALNSVLDQMEDPEEFAARARSLHQFPDQESFDTLTFKDGRVFERYSMPQRIDGKPVGRVWSFRDVTARHRAETEIRHLNASLEARVAQRTAELESRNRALETFTYSVSHDLKAPLRGIDGYSRLLLEEQGERLDDEGRRFIGSIRRGTQQMSQLIEDLLAYSRVERRDVRAESVDLREVIASVLAERAGDVAVRGVSVTVDGPALTVAADREGLTMALRNLVENALKFSQKVDRATVGITTFSEGESWGVRVTDNGVGFDMKFHDRIFDIFQRLHRVEDYPGTGVGLAIVKKAMERMGGSARAESTLGGGATFILEVPT